MDIDQIYSEINAVATKRAAGIATVGTEYRLFNTERAFKAVLSADRKTAMFETGARLQVGQIYQGKTGDITIIAHKTLPGCCLADVAEVTSTVTVLQKTATHGPQGAAVILTSTSQTAPTLSHASTKGDEVTVPVRYAALRGKVLKTASGQLLEVVGARIEGSVAHLKCEPYREPESKSMKREQSKPRWVTDPPLKDSWHSSNIR